MKFINLEFSTSREETLALISDNERVNRNVNFDERRGKPLMRIKDKGDGKIKITCEMLGRATKDNGFIVGTYFTGRLKAQDGKTQLRGVILTAPIYHLVLIAFMVLFAIQCIYLKGFSLVPIVILAFSLFMCKDEFKKQGYIVRYLTRAARRTYKE